MYNALMSAGSYEIRICVSCGLRFPLLEGHPFGPRCPVCMGETRVGLSRKLAREPGPALLSGPGRREKELPENLRGSPAFAVLLDNIRSAWNVGSILRSADGFGFAHAYLCGITPSADTEAVTKTALGAEDSVPWSYHKDAVKLVTGLKKEGCNVYALENEPRSEALSQFPGDPFPQPGVLILGNEVTGVDPDLLDLCDGVFHIPMHGEKTSFNVAITFGIAAYALTACRPPT